MLALVYDPRLEQSDGGLREHLETLPFRPQPLEKREAWHPELVRMWQPCDRTASRKVSGRSFADGEELCFIRRRDAADPTQIEGELSEPARTAQFLRIARRVDRDTHHPHLEVLLDVMQIARGRLGKGRDSRRV